MIDLEKIVSQRKYCFLCKGGLEIKGKNWLQCKSCGYRDFVNPAPTSGAILLNEQGEILLVKRNTEPGKGLWDLPGGFTDIGESSEEGMRRELKEELGITIGDLKYLGSYADTYMFDGIEIVTLGVVFICKLENREVKLNNEASEYKFFKPANIPSGEIAFKGVEGGLKDYLKIVQ